MDHGNYWRGEGVNYGFRFTGLKFLPYHKNISPPPPISKLPHSISLKFCSKNSIFKSEDDTALKWSSAATVGAEANQVNKFKNLIL